MCIRSITGKKNVGTEKWVYQFCKQGRQNRFVLHLRHLTTCPLSFLWHWWHIHDSSIILPCSTNKYPHKIKVFTQKKSGGTQWGSSLFTLLSLFTPRFTGSSSFIGSVLPCYNPKSDAKHPKWEAKQCYGNHICIPHFVYFWFFCL